jgi:predicted DsbA family dithiol-disulfide isomerase
VARVAYQLAASAKHVTTDVVEVQEFIDLAQKYQVRGVPMTIVNEGAALMGAVPAMQIVETVLRAGTAP